MLLRNSTTLPTKEEIYWLVMLMTKDYISKDLRRKFQL